MKRRVLSLLCVMVLTVSMSGCSGCGKEDIKLTAQAASVEMPEIRVFEDGKVSSSLVVDFKESYYNMEDLEKKSKEDIDKYNSENSTKISFNSLEKKDDNAVMVLDFDNIDEYVKCNFADSADLKLLSGDDAKGNDDVPSDIGVYGKDKTESKDKAIKSKYKVLIVSPKVEKKEDDNKENVTPEEEKKGYEITVDGDIEYSSNVEKKDDNTVRYTDFSEKAIIVFNP